LLDQWIWDGNDDRFLGRVLYNPIATQPIAGPWPFLLGATLSPPSPLSSGPAGFQLDFSEPMSVTVQPTVTFGLDPAADTHIVAGDWINSTRWAGTTTIDPYTGDGANRLRVAGARAEDNGNEMPDATHFTFQIAAIGATAVQAQGGYGRVDLSWNPSTLPTLAGYNVYRSTTAGGPYTRLNAALITGAAYTDLNVTNGVPYYYVVCSPLISMRRPTAARRPPPRTTTQRHPRRSSSTTAPPRSRQAGCTHRGPLRTRSPASPSTSTVSARGPAARMW
jgi:hypothetical protein